LGSGEDLTYSLPAINDDAETVNAAMAAKLVGTWNSIEEDDMGYNFPSLRLFNDGTAHFQTSDDWVYVGTYTYSNKVVHFTGSPGGDHATEEDREQEEEFSFVLRKKLLVTKYGDKLRKEL
jgi:hypothetical protein